MGDASGHLANMLVYSRTDNMECHGQAFVNRQRGCEIVSHRCGRIISHWSATCTSGYCQIYSGGHQTQPPACPGQNAGKECTHPVREPESISLSNIHNQLALVQKQAGRNRNRYRLHQDIRHNHQAEQKHPRSTGSLPDNEHVDGRSYWCCSLCLRVSHIPGCGHSLKLSARFVYKQTCKSHVIHMLHPLADLARFGLSIAPHLRSGAFGQRKIPVFAPSPTVRPSKLQALYKQALLLVGHLMMPCMAMHCSISCERWPWQVQQKTPATMTCSFH
jgi:hypothetical protein